MVGGTVVTRHPSVIAVAACDRCGRPLSESSLGNSIGRRGVSEPGEGITSLGTDGNAVPSAKRVGDSRAMREFRSMESNTMKAKPAKLACSISQGQIGLPASSPGKTIRW
jgi:hypothetical protein